MNNEKHNIDWIYVADRNLIPLNEGKKIHWGDKQIALFNLGTEFLAVDNHCPHKQGPLADGIVAGGSVFCPLHNLKIDLKSGCAVAGGTGSVHSYPVRLEGDKIFLGFETTEEEIVMKEVMAIIRPNKWAETKQKLANAGIFTFTQRRVYGRGKQKGLLYMRQVKSGETSSLGIQFIPKRIVVIVVPEAQVKTVLNALIEANQTGAIGDGKIFISNVEQLIPVRTGLPETRVKKFKADRIKEAQI